jgi:transient receptor potential cation channel subfamily A protein 1
MDLVLFIRKMPRFGIYVVMFTDILWTFAQFFPVFILFIVAFAMAFYALIQNQYEFRNVGQSLLKTSVMMIGEIEFGDIFLEKGTSTEYGDEIFYDITTYIVFVLFLILMTVIIMNLLVGLAVDDIKAVQEQAVLKRLAMQVELALDVEALLPHFLRKRTMLKCTKIKPNEETNYITKFFHLESGTLSATAISKALHPDLSEMEQLQENQEKTMGQVHNLRQRMKTMAEQNERLQSMMSALLQHHNINLDEEDVIVEG